MQLAQFVNNLLTCAGGVDKLKPRFYNKSVQRHRKEVFMMQATFTRKKGTTKDGRDYDFISGRTIPDNTEFTISKSAAPRLPEKVKKLLEEKNLTL